jgi:hypothetical protein
MKLDQSAKSFAYNNNQHHNVLTTNPSYATTIIANQDYSTQPNSRVTLLNHNKQTPVIKPQ